MKPLNKNKLRSIEITLITLGIIILMGASFFAGIQVCKLYNELRYFNFEYVDNLNKGAVSSVIRADSDKSEGESELAQSKTDETITATITAYTSSVEETDDTPCLSASGIDLCNQYGIMDLSRFDFDGIVEGVLACPKKYDFGTTFLIPIKLDCGLSYYKRYMCVDRMNSKYDGQERFDIYFGQGEEAYQMAMEWGKRKLEIKIITNYE